MGELGECSPNSREAEGKGGEGFYIGRRPDLLVIWGEIRIHDPDLSDKNTISGRV
jgi:hypothetical protein